MKQKDLSILLQKAEELKALFIFGQRVIPFLEEIFYFLRDIQPLFEEIDTSIKENLKKMPNASRQLSKVTEATELATTEIMDIIDSLVYKTELIENNLKSINSSEANKKIPDKVVDMLINAASNENEISHEALQNILNEIKTANIKDNDKAIANSIELLESIKSDSSSIMMSLQVQDITAQQIAAVNHLLEKVQDKLKYIIERFNQTDLKDVINLGSGGYERANISTMHRKIAFDPDAIDTMDTKGTKQNEVDSIIESSIKEFGAESDLEKEILSEIARGNEFEESERSEQFSQDDIDALFGK